MFCLEKPLVLDGALGSELVKYDQDVDNPLWSTRTVILQPDVIKQIHTNYLETGADIILTSTYQSSIVGLIKYGAQYGIYTEKDALSVLQKSVDLAKEAVREHNAGSRRYIAGSIGPFGAYMNDLSEYTGAYKCNGDDLYQFHYEKIKFLAENEDIDLLAFETIPNFNEIKTILSIISVFEKPFYLSMNFKSGTELCDGTPITDLLSYIKENECLCRNMVAIGSNCINLEYSQTLIQNFHQILPGAKFVIYPNSGEVFDVATNEYKHLDVNYDWKQFTTNWLENGAYIIGGCCRTSPKEIGLVRECVDEYILKDKKK